MLLLDRGASLGEQRLLGLASWVLLALLLWGQDALTRLSVGVVVVYASLIEYTFSGYLHVYVYRLHGAGLSALRQGAELRAAGSWAGLSRCRRARPKAAALVGAGGGHRGERVRALGAVPVAAARRARGAVGGLPAVVALAGSRQAGLRGGVRRRHLPRTARHGDRHLALAAAQPHIPLDCDGQSAVGRGRRLLLLRRGRAGDRAGAAALDPAA